MKLTFYNPVNNDGQSYGITGVLSVFYDPADRTLNAMRGGAEKSAIVATLYESPHYGWLWSVVDDVEDVIIDFQAWSVDEEDRGPVEAAGEDFVVLDPSHPDSLGTMMNLLGGGDD